MMTTRRITTPMTIHMNSPGSELPALGFFCPASETDNETQRKKEIKKEKIR